MGVGDKWRLWLPSELAYGDAGRSDQKRGQYIPPGAVLVFELEILAVKGATKPKPKRPPQPAADGSYVPASTFRGMRPGFTFRAGEWGSGYYRDAVQTEREQKQAAANSESDTIMKLLGEHEKRQHDGQSQPAAPDEAAAGEPAAESEPADENDDGNRPAGGTLFERQPIQYNRRAASESSNGEGAGCMTARTLALSGRQEAKDELLRILKGRLADADSPLEAAYVLLSHLAPRTVRYALDDLGIATSDVEPQAEQLKRIIQALEC